MKTYKVTLFRSDIHKANSITFYQAHKGADVVLKAGITYISEEEYNAIKNNKVFLHYLTNKGNPKISVLEV